MHTKKVTIDWDDVERELGTNEGTDDVESIIHEIAHVFDCAKE